MHNELVNLIADMMEEEALLMVNDLIEKGTHPLEILDDARAAMELVGQRFETGQYSIPYLMMAGEILRQISDTVKPLIEKEQTGPRKGRVLIGTVAGDIHDIGKDIVVFILDANSYEVIDVGIDVSVDIFVEKVRLFNPQVVCLSGFITAAFDSMRRTIEALRSAGLRDKVKIMIGGGQIDEQVMKYVGADAYGVDARGALELCRQWIGG